jgi:hypothetical protein
MEWYDNGNKQYETMYESGEQVKQEILRERMYIETVP